MATLSTRMMRRRCASNSTRFILLLAFIAATSFRCNGDASGTNSMFAFAAEQTNQGNRGLLRRTQSAVLEEKGEGTCEDSDEYNKKDKDGNKLTLCQWAAEKPKRLKRRCKRIIKKKNPEGPGKIDVSVQEQCGCTCSKFADIEPPQEPETPVVDTPVVDTPVVDTPVVDTPEKDETQVSCPDPQTPESSLAGSMCSTLGQYCGYRYTAFGCTQDDYKCLPVVECFCTDETERGPAWHCIEHAQRGPTQCDEPRPPPEEYEAPPSNVGQSCDPEENTGSAEDLAPADSETIIFD